MRITRIYCRVMTREMGCCIARSRNIITPHCLPSGLHDLGAGKTSARIQETIDALDGEWSEEDFAVCHPGQRFVARVASSIIDVEPVKG